MQSDLQNIYTKVETTRIFPQPLRLRWSHSHQRIEPDPSKQNNPEQHG